MFDLVSKIAAPTTTWAISVPGQHGRDHGYIMQSFSNLTDRFIDEYLRVNEDAGKENNDGKL